MKKVIALTMLVILALCFAGCGNSKAPATPPATEAPKEPPVLTGEWTQTNKKSEDSYQIATITDSTIEVYWKTPDSKSLYWAGTFTPPTAAGDYKWDSVNDKEKTDFAMLASGDDTKTFTYSNGELSYEVSALGTTTTVKMVKDK